MRPWDQARGQEQEAGVGRTGSRRKSAGDSPLDALFNMASNFEAMKAKSGKDQIMYRVSLIKSLSTSLESIPRKVIIRSACSNLEHTSNEVQRDAKVVVT